MTPGGRRPEGSVRQSNPESLELAANWVEVCAGIRRRLAHSNGVIEAGLRAVYDRRARIAALIAKRSEVNR